MTQTSASRTWTLAWAALVGMSVSGNAFGIATQSLFLAPMAKEFGWSRTDFFTPLAFASLCGAAFAPLVGRIADRRGVRQTLLPGAILYGASIACLALLNGSIAQYVMLAIFHSLGSMLHGPLLYSKAVALSADRRRGLALAIGMSGSALGTIYVPHVTRLLIEHLGWRGARVGLGAMVVLVAVPVIYFFIRPPRSDRQADAGMPGAGPVEGLPAPEGLSLHEALRTRTFWLLIAVFMFSSAAIHGALGHLAPLAADKGFQASLAATSLSALGLAQLGSRFASGYLLDKLRTPQIGQIWFILALAGLLVLAAASHPWMMVAGAALVGCALGAELELLAYYISRFFGMRSFGQIYGLIFSAFMVGLSAGPFVMARLFDLNGDYRFAFPLIQGLMALSVAALALVGNYVYLSGHAPRR